MFEECKNCIAKPFCKIYSGEIKSKEKKCSPKKFLDKALNLSYIPPEFKGANIYNAKVDDQNRACFNTLMDSIDNIVELVDKGRNFLIYGSGVGTGKTYMGSLILNHYIYKTCQTEKFDYENPLALFCDYSELMDNLRYSDNESLEAEFEKLKKVPLLLLDDLGAGTVSDFVREQTFLIINHRYNHRLSTVVTSNLIVDDWEELFGARIVSRLTRDAILLYSDGTDRR